MRLVAHAVTRQGDNRDLLRRLVHAQVPFAPCPAFVLAVDAPVPLALAEDFQTRRVHENRDLLTP